jgi:hypothetical protein
VFGLNETTECPNVIEILLRDSEFYIIFLGSTGGVDKTHYLDNI